MRILRGVGLVGIGLVLGLLVTVPKAFQERRAPPKDRLVFTDAGSNTNTSRMVFIRDSYSGGCWLGVDVRAAGVTTLAVAPAKSCDQ